MNSKTATDSEVFEFIEIDNNKPTNLLYLPCGSATDLMNFVSEHENLVAYGIDTNSKHLNYAIESANKMNITNRMHFYADNPSLGISLANYMFDHVIVDNIVEKFSGVYKIINGSYRVLKPNTTALFTETKYETIKWKNVDKDLTKEIVDAFLKEKSHYSKDIPLYKPERLKKELDKSPFQTIKENPIMKKGEGLKPGSIGRAYYEAIAFLIEENPKHKKHFNEFKKALHNEHKKENQIEFTIEKTVYKADKTL